MSQQLPETVHFKTNGVDCIAHCAFGKIGFNMRSCQINFMQTPTIEVTKIEEFSRVYVSRNELDSNPVWFDTSHKSAADIVTLVKTGKAPSA